MTADPAWLLYVKHLSPAGGRWSVPLALAGIAIVLWRSSTRARWMPAVLFTLAYFYILSTHSHVFGRYALPLVPMLCLFISVAACSRSSLSRHASRRWRGRRSSGR